MNHQTLRRWLLTHVQYQMKAEAYREGDKERRGTPFLHCEETKFVTSNKSDIPKIKSKSKYIENGFNSFIYLTYGEKQSTLS